MVSKPRCLLLPEERESLELEPAVFAIAARPQTKAAGPLVADPVVSGQDSHLCAHCLPLVGVVGPWGMVVAARGVAPVGWPAGPCSVEGQPEAAERGSNQSLRWGWNLRWEFETRGISCCERRIAIGRRRCRFSSR